MGIARQWSFNSANYISSQGDFTEAAITGKVTFAAWVKIARNDGSTLGISGKRISTGGLIYGSRWSVFSPTPSTCQIYTETFKAWNTFSSDKHKRDQSNTFTGFLNSYVFLASVFDGALGSYKFYKGTNNLDVAELGTAVSEGTCDGVSEVGATGDIDVGRWGGTSGQEQPFDGNMTMLGAWRAALTLAELKNFAGCNIVRPEDAIYIYRITGASPEPTSSTMQPTHTGVIFGLVPVVNEATGCSSSLIVNSPPVPGLLKPPPFTGGPGPMDYDEGSTGSAVGPNEGFLHQAPNFASLHRATGARGLLGRAKTPKIAKRYFSLDHLAADIRTKRGHLK